MSYILFVDDEEQIRKLLSTYLTRQGHEVALATDGYEALKAIRSRMPDLVITDVSMPNMNGFRGRRRIRGEADRDDRPRGEDRGPPQARAGVRGRDAEARRTRHRLRARQGRRGHDDAGGEHRGRAR
ncbi:MAG: response regulator [Chloroflexi bacterium]|nr:MAG: response regulator [Chloroflexota bacterium]